MEPLYNQTAKLCCKGHTGTLSHDIITVTPIKWINLFTIMTTEFRVCVEEHSANLIDTSLPFPHHTFADCVETKFRVNASSTYTGADNTSSAPLL